MINCSKEIEKYHNEKVRLSESDRSEMRERRKANQDRLKENLKKKGKPLPIRFIKQGSYAMYTMTQAPDKNYDIDDGAVFSRADLKSPEGADMTASEAREMVRDALDDGSFKTPPKSLKNCVRVFYEAGYHVDVPVYREFEDENKNTVLELASSDWRKSDPTEITSWFNNAVIDKSPDSTNGRQMRRCVCLLKKFARSREAWDLPTGLILSVLTDEKYSPKNDRDDEALYDLMQAIYDRLVQTGYCVMNPCDLNEELTKGADDPKMQELKDRLSWALDRLRDVKNETCDRNEAMRRWNDVFNTDFFDQFITDKNEEPRKQREKISVVAAAIASKAPKQWAS